MNKLTAGKDNQAQSSSGGDNANSDNNDYSSQENYGFNGAED